jgi:hypothetical protein
MAADPFIYDALTDTASPFFFTNPDWLPGAYSPVINEIAARALKNGEYLLIVHGARALPGAQTGVFVYHYPTIDDLIADSNRTLVLSLTGPYSWFDNGLSVSTVFSSDPPPPQFWTARRFTNEIS